MITPLILMWLPIAFWAGSALGHAVASPYPDDAVESIGWLPRALLYIAFMILFVLYRLCTGPISLIRDLRR